MEQGVLTEVGLPIALFVIMIGMGLTLVPRDFREILVAPRASFYGVIAQILLLPLCAFVVASLLNLSPALAVGLVVIAACPGGTTSNLFVFIGRGDLALSIVLTVAASLITIITLPFFANQALAHYQDTVEVIRLPFLRTVGTMVGIILVPVMIGMTVRRFAPGFAGRAERPVSLFGLVVLVGVILLLVIQVGDQAEELARQAGLPALLLNLLGLALGLGVGRLVGLSREEAFTVAIELAIKNGTLGLMVTLTLLESSEMSVPAAVYSMLMFLFGFVMLGYSRLAGIGAPEQRIADTD